MRAREARDAENRAGGAGNGLSLGIGERAGSTGPRFGALVLWCFVFVVTESSTGPIKRFKEMIVAHVGGHG